MSQNPLMCARSTGRAGSPAIKIAATLVASVLWLVLGGAGCQPMPTTQPSPTWTASPTLNQTPAPSVPISAERPTFQAVLPSQTPESVQFVTETPTLTPPPPTLLPTIPANQASEYALDVIFDYAAHSLSVTEAITFTNSSNDTLNGLVLMIEANRYPGSFSIIEISVESQPITDYSLLLNRLEIPLAQPLSPGQTTHLRILYISLLPPIPDESEMERPQPFGYTGRQDNVVDWYPYIPPYRDGVGWIAYDPWFFAEHQVYASANYQVQIQVQSNGVPLTIAASAPAEREGDIYRYQLQQARSFAWSISPSYIVFSDTVGEVTVYSYAYSFSADGGQAALLHTRQALALYTELFGPYPHASLSVVQADFMDGMEYEGLYFLSRGFYNIYDGTVQNYLTAISVHETAHQWWYGLVGNDQALEPWLDEALCTYSELLYYEKYYPKVVDSWWEFRVNMYQPRGAVNGAIYDYPSFWTYRDAVYLNGALYLKTLRKEAGDEAFFAFLKEYARRYAHQQASSQDFFAVFSEVTGLDGKAMLEDTQSNP